MDIDSGLKSTLAYSTGIFAAVGAGVGLTAAIIINLLGSGSSIVSGILTLMVIGTVLLLGPPVAAYIGIQIGERDGKAGAVQSVIGSVIGFLTMMLIVLLILFLGIAIAMGGGTGADSGTGGGMDSGTGDSGGFDIVQYLIPALLVALPTGLTGGATTYLHGRSSFSGAATTGGSDIESEAPDIPTKYIVGAILAILILIAGAYGVMAFMSSPADNLEVSNGNANVQNGDFYGEATVTNTGDSPATANLNMRLKIDGEYKEGFESTNEVTVEPGGEVQLSYVLGPVDELNQEEKQKTADGNYVIEYYINGNLRYTY